MKEQAPEQVRAIAHLVERLFVMMRTHTSHGAGHPVAGRAAGRVAEAIAAAGPPFALQFVAEGLFQDQNLVPLTPETFESLTPVSRALNNLGIQELLFTDRAAREDSAARLGEVLATGAVGPGGASADEIAVPGVTAREILNAVRGISGEAVDPEVYAAAQVAQSVAAAETVSLDRAEPWPWSVIVAIVRRLERAIKADAASAAETMEVAPGEWSVPRRAVSACHRSLTLSTELGLRSSTRRAAAHACLCLALHGYEERWGIELRAAAEMSLARLLDSPLGGRSGVDPHRLRVLSLLEAMAQGRAGDLPPAGGVQLCYELERRRRPRDVDFWLALSDLMAQLVTNPIPDLEPRWVRLLIQVVGEVPPGARVRLADGRTGVALGPGAGGDPSRPRVLVDGRAVEVDVPVTILSSGASA